jgi:cobalt-zinc-cadmium efflux system membrane fusion protein
MKNIRNRKTALLCAAILVAAAALVILVRWQSPPGIGFAAAVDNHSAGEESSTAHRHENESTEEEGEMSDLDRPVDELWQASCEHEIPTHTCDECRYEIGVVKLSPELLGDGSNAGLVSTVTAEVKDFS